MMRIALLGVLAHEISFTIQILEMEEIVRKKLYIILSIIFLYTSRIFFSNTQYAHGMQANHNTQAMHNTIHKQHTTHNTQSMHSTQAMHKTIHNQCIAQATHNSQAMHSVLAALNKSTHIHRHIHV